MYVAPRPLGDDTTIVRMTKTELFEIAQGMQNNGYCVRVQCTGQDSGRRFTFNVYAEHKLIGEGFHVREAYYILQSACCMIDHAKTLTSGLDMGAIENVMRRVIKDGDPAETAMARLRGKIEHLNGVLLRREELFRKYISDTHALGPLPPL